jgi:hypothetical protein
LLGLRAFDFDQRSIQIWQIGCKQFSIIMVCPVQLCQGLTK